MLNAISQKLLNISPDYPSAETPRQSESKEKFNLHKDTLV